MDFLDPAKRQAHVRRLFIGYFLVGVAVALAATIMVVLSNGYDLDRKTGKVIQNGLIFAATNPVDSNVYLNGVDNGQTDKRLTVPAGKYDVEYRSKGYQTWKKTVNLNGGSIERLSYAKLFPTKLNAVEAKVYEQLPVFSSQSPDRRWILVSKPGDINTFDVFDTANPNDKPKPFTVAKALLTDTKKDTEETLKLVEWSTDNRHILVKHTFGDSNEFVVIDRQNEDSYNVNTVFKESYKTVALRDKKFDQLYLYNKGAKTLSQANLKDKKATEILTSVTNFKSYRDKTLLYTVDDPAVADKVLVRIYDNGKSYTLRTVNAGEVHLDMASYEGAIYVGVAPVKEDKLYIFKDPLVKLAKSKDAEVAPFSLARINSPEKISFSTNTRFLAVQSKNKFSVYDFEEKRRSAFDLDGKIDGQLATWMDGHRLTINQENKLMVFEFDGNNIRDLGVQEDSSLPYFDKNYQRLYTLRPVEDDKDKFALNRTSLVVDLKP